MRDNARNQAMLSNRKSQLRHNDTALCFFSAAGAGIRIFAALLGFVGSLSAQRVDFGFVGGVPITNVISAVSGGPVSPDFNTCYACGKGRTVPYTIGPALEVHIAGRFSVLAQALYSRADYDSTIAGLNDIVDEYTVRERKDALNRWDFPILLKYRFGTRLVTPYVAGGVSIEYSRDLPKQQLNGSAVFANLFPNFPAFYQFGVFGPQNDAVIAGPAASVGSNFRVNRHFRPFAELRYTYWPVQAVNLTPKDLAIINAPVNLSAPAVSSSRNQVQFLFGIVF
jgi:hypothetical protein